MTQNSFPTEFIELPSKGHFYPEDNPLSSGKVEMKYMTAKEEDILTSVNLIQQGVVLDKLLETLVVDKSINLDDILIGDKNALIVGARILAYGKNYELTTNNLEKQISVEVEALKKVYKDVEPENSTRLKYQIISVDGNQDRKFINNFVDNEFLSVDSLAFREHIKAITPTIDFTAEVKNSQGGKETATVPITVGFFWPESRI
jgi:hypothetical protein